MSSEVFLTIYLLFLLITVVLEIWILMNNKRKYLRKSYNSIKKILSSLAELKNHPVDMYANEFLRFYNAYAQEEPQIKRFYPNVISWLDAIIYNVDCNRGSARILDDSILIIKDARDILKEQNPFDKCEKYQQGILCDLNKLKTDENKMILENVIGRTEEEFIRLSTDIKKNSRMTLLSIFIGVMGILVSILMACVKL